MSYFIILSQEFRQDVSIGRGAKEVFGAFDELTNLDSQEKLSSGEYGKMCI